MFLGAEEIPILPEGMSVRSTERLRPFFALKDIAKGEQLVWNYEYHEPCKVVQGQCSCGLPLDECYEFKVAVAFSKVKISKSYTFIFIYTVHYVQVYNPL